MNNYTSLIHGHNHPKVREAVAKQLECGTIFGAPIKVNVSCLKFYSIEFHLSKR
jgi:glutamate-1-semialdehyde aminotransferase